MSELKTIYFFNPTLQDFRLTLRIKTLLGDSTTVKHWKIGKGEQMPIQFDMEDDKNKMLVLRQLANFGCHDEGSQTFSKVQAVTWGFTSIVKHKLENAVADQAAARDKRAAEALKAAEGKTATAVMVGDNPENIEARLEGLESDGLANLEEATGKKNPSRR